MASVRYSVRARQDLLEIWTWIATDNLDAADRVIDKIEQSCARLHGHPHLGMRRPEIDIDARMLVIARWIAFYRVLQGDVQIVRIVDGSRDLDRLNWPTDGETA